MAGLSEADGYVYMGNTTSPCAPHSRHTFEGRQHQAAALVLKLVLAQVDHLQLLLPNQHRRQGASTLGRDFVERQVQLLRHETASVAARNVLQGIAGMHPHTSPQRGR